MTSRRITPVELASAGIMSGLTVVLGLVASALPVLDQPLKIASALPVALMAIRFSSAATSVTAVAAVSVAFGMGGALTAFSVFQYVLIGWVLGVLYRRKSWRVTLWLSMLGVGVFITALKFGLLLILSESRQLTLDAMKTSFEGYVKLIGKIPGASQGAAQAQHMLEWLVVHWWVWLPLYLFVWMMIRILICRWLLKVVVRRMSLVEVVDRFVEAPAASRSEAARSSSIVLDEDVVAPLPMDVRHVCHRYHEHSPLALDDVSFRVKAGEFVVIAGPNGSGKSTLASILAGASATSGHIVTAGRVGRGAEGGLAYLSQSPDVRVIGHTVREDLLWGHDLSAPGAFARISVLADECLERVGLADLSHASTRHLSGGELQRLALATALMRQPSLIISDETTAMIDPAGRRLMMSIFQELAAEGITVIHITHDTSEAASAQRLIRLDSGRLIFDGQPHQDAWVASGGVVLPEADTPTQVLVAKPRPSSTNLWVRNVTHIVNEKTPWSREILSDIAFIVAPRDSVLITGPNGSGKTTLARLMTGLVCPTFGSVTLGSQEMWKKVGEVSLSHQFARLQLLRPTVGEDILDAIGHAQLAQEGSSERKAKGEARPARQYDEAGLPVFSDEELATIASALGTVGLPAELATRGIDELSGGQQRRVALAGLIAARPAVLILDEPFAGLDAHSRQLLVNVLAQLREGGMSLVLISHDDDGLHALADRHVRLCEGRMEDAPVTPRVRGIRRPTPVRFPQPLPWESPMSRMWAGAKILSWSAILTLLLFFPNWASIACVAVFLTVTSLLARMPLRALPNLPAPFWTGMAGGLVGASISGGFLVFTQFLVIMLLFLWGTALILLTTHTLELTGALAVFFRPLQRIFTRVPLWIHAMTFSVRSVPMLMDQSRALQDTMTIRLYRQSRITTRQIFAHFVDVATASLASAAHRGALMGTAISMRGGIPPLHVPPQRVGRADLLLAVLTLLTVGAMISARLML